MSREGRPRWGALQTFLIGQPGNPMMKRLRLIQTPWFGIYLHFIYREDLDPIPHDHPWTFWRVVLWGSYSENHWLHPDSDASMTGRVIERWRPSVFPTTEAHWITAVQPGTVSLVVVGRKQRVWGFWDEVPGVLDRNAAVRRWVDYRDALALRPTEGSRSQHNGAVR